MNNVYEEYAAVQAEITALELKKEQLRPHILEMILGQGVDKLETSLGKFSIYPVKKWTYPAKVKNLKDEYDAAKATAESTGEAVCVETPSFKFTPTKI